MINVLRKRLCFLFTSSVMLLFTAVLGLMLHNSLASSRSAENDMFQRAASNLLLNLENIGNVSPVFHLYEQDYPFLFFCFDEYGNVLYQTASDDTPQFLGIVNAFEEEIGKEATNYKDSSSYNQSGIFYFSYEDIPYCGIYGETAVSHTQKATVYLIKPKTAIMERLKEELEFYLAIWCMILAAVTAISHFLIHKATQPTESAIQSQKNFIAAASHELKAPLAVILTNAETTADDPDLAAHLQKNLSAIDAECMRMSGLVQDLLLLSSIDSGAWTLTKTSVDIFSFALSVYEKFEPLCRQHRRELVLDLANDVYPEFAADINRLEQILGIFLDNAIHYGQPGSPITLTVRTECKNAGGFLAVHAAGTKCISFTVKDHGPGIPAEDKPFIFDRFYQADKSRTHTQRYGLGLSIAKELVDMHKGKITLTDTPGGGCTFQISFPLATA